MISHGARSLGTGALLLIGFMSAASRAEDARPLISHLDQELHRLVVVVPDSGNVYLYDIKSDDLKLLAVRNMANDRSSVAKVEPKPAEAAKPLERDVPGQDIEGVPRPASSRRFSYSARIESSGTLTAATYKSTESAAKLYEQMIAALSEWKITYRSISGNPDASSGEINALRAGVELEIVFRSGRPEDLVDVHISRTDRGVEK
ncbi:MAG: hypothetical protein U0V87_16545 [Acidobacteriota bacterium]